ncbi:MAG TPA: FKBP-type peptidyl-prolyl cis-trans isomerase [Candidatus Angelobacter sp.]
MLPSTAPAQAKTPDAPAPKADSAAPFANQKDKVSYAIGMNIGSGIHRQSVDVNPDVLAQGIKDAIAGKTQITEEEARAAIIQLQTELRAKQEEQAKQAADTNKKEGEAFLASNKTKEGVVTLPSGLEYKILKAGTGPKPTASDTVVCNYRGTLINGKEFDANQGAEFPVGRVIAGWTEALKLMPVGSKWQLAVPSDLAYGPRGTPDGTIGPNATLLFDVELVSIKPPEGSPSPK